MRERNHGGASTLRAARGVLGIAPAASDADAIKFRRARDSELREAKQFFQRFTALEAAFDPKLVDLYAEDGVLIERTLQNGVEKRAREIPLRKYKAMLCDGLAFSARAKETSTHANISAEHLAPGWVIIRSTRAYTHSRVPAPYEIVVRRDERGWRVVKEIAAVTL